MNQSDSIRFGVGRRVIVGKHHATVTYSVPVYDLVEKRYDVKIDAKNDAGKYVAVAALVHRNGVVAA